MANKITIPVELQDNTAEGLASIEANAKATSARVNQETYALGGMANDTYDLKHDTSADDARQRKLENARRLDAMVADQNTASQDAGVAASAERDAAAFAKLTADVNRFNDTLRQSAVFADRLSDELQQVDFPEQEIESVRMLWAEVDKTRNATELAAQAFEQLGQQESAQRLRIGLTQTADSALRLKSSLNQLEVRKLAIDMAASGNAAKSTAVDIGAAGREAALAASGFNKLQQAATSSAGRRSGAGQGILQLAYAVDDVQYGLRGIVNNIPMLVQGLGASAAAAGKLAIAAVVISQIANHWEELQKLLQNPRGWQIAKDHASRAMSQISDTIDANLQAARKGVMAFADSWGLVPDAVKEFADSELEATGRSIVSREKLAAEKAKQAAAEKGYAENSQAAMQRQWKDELEQLDTLDKLKQKANALRDALGPTKKGSIAMTPEQTAEAVKHLGEVEAKLHDVGNAKAKLEKEFTKSQEDEAYKRNLAHYNEEIKSLDQVRDRIAELEELKRGKATGVAGATDLDDKNRKRINAEILSLQEKEHQLARAITERGKENARQQVAATENLAEQTAELTKQQQLENALHEIEKKRAAIASGADDPAAESARLAQQASRDAFLDRVRLKTEHAKQLAEQVASSETASDQEKAKRRADYEAAVQNQITAEANAKRQALSAQMSLDAQRASLNAGLDQEALALRQKAAQDAEAAFTKAQAEKFTADAETNAKDETRRKKAADELSKATSDRLRTQADLAKQIADNEQARRDRAEKNQQSHTRQRIADEIAVGKAREKALLDAAQREQEIEDAKNAKRQAALRGDPRVQRVAEQVVGRIKPQDVRRAAIKQRQDAAEKKLRAERQQARKPVKPGEVRKAREKAGIEFQKDFKKGKAQAELADVGEAMFRRMVDDARGLEQPIADALKAIAGEAAQRIRDAGQLGKDVEKAEKAKPGDPKAQRVAAGKERVAAEKKADEEKEKPEPVEPVPQKTAEQIKAEMLAKREARNKANAEEKARREQAKRDAEAKARADAERQQAIVDANVRAADEKAARERETPEQTAARAQREDAEFRQHKEAEHDRRQQEAFKAQQQPAPPTDNLAAANGTDVITIEANADTADAERELDELAKDREAVVTVRVEQAGQREPLADLTATDTVKVRREPEFADGPRPAREPVRFADEPKLAPVGQPVPPVPMPSQAAAPISAAVSSVNRGAQTVANTDAAIIDGFNSIAKNFQDLAGQQLKTADVVAQIIAHINNDGAKFLSEANSISMRAARAAA